MSTWQGTAKGIFCRDVTIFFLVFGGIFFLRKKIFILKMFFLGLFLCETQVKKILMQNSNNNNNKSSDDEDPRGVIFIPSWTLRSEPYRSWDDMKTWTLPQKMEGYFMEKLAACLGTMTPSRSAYPIICGCCGKIPFSNSLVVIGESHFPTKRVFSLPRAQADVMVICDTESCRLLMRAKFKYLVFHFCTTAQGYSYGFTSTLSSTEVLAVQACPQPPIRRPIQLKDSCLPPSAQEYGTSEKQSIKVDTERGLEKLSLCRTFHDFESVYEKVSYEPDSPVLFSSSALFTAGIFATMMYGITETCTHFCACCERHVTGGSFAILQSTVPERKSDWDRLVSFSCLAPICLDVNTRDITEENYRLSLCIVFYGKQTTAIYCGLRAKEIAQAVNDLGKLEPDEHKALQERFKPTTSSTCEIQ
jgi:hypothetical protein